MGGIATDTFRAIVDRIGEVAEREGLSAGRVHFTLCDRVELSRVAAYGGMVRRYPHWSFGKTYERLRTAQDYHRARIYEVVIHQNPVCAFVDRQLEPAAAMLVVAHVLAHAAFFRTHRLLRDRPPDAIAWMARHRQETEALMATAGAERVEAVLDGAEVLADFAGDHLRAAEPGAEPSDLLGYVAVHAPALGDAERELLLRVRDEARYLRPQILTKIANEGYATFWHRRVLRRVPLDWDDRIAVARFNADLVSVRNGDLNPYRLGYTLVRKAWEAEGLSGLRWVSEDLSDVALVREYLDGEGVRLAGLRLTEGNAQTDPTEAIRDRLIADLDHGGVPYLEVDARRTEAARGTLHLVHRGTARDLDLGLLPGALHLVATLWGGPVMLTSHYRGRRHRLGHDGTHWIDEMIEGRSVYG